MEKVNKMTQIDTSKWGKFRMGDLFETFHGERLKKSDRIEGSTPFVTAGSENQGVADYIVTEKKYSDAITIDMFGNCFYHNGILFGDDNIYFLISNNISKYSKLFVTTIINSTLKEKYSFSHQFRQKDLDTLTINLPSTQDNFPDWQFMEDYMKEITKLAAKRVEKLKEEKPQAKIDTSKWGNFKVGDLFEIKPTKSYKMRNADLLDGGNTPVVVNSAFNNGIGGFTTQQPTEKGGIITFSDTVDANTIFYQEKPFAGYSHVQGVYPVGEWANEWDKYSLLFFASCFKSTALRYGFDYSNKFRRDVALELKVLLPQTPDHTPDFDYMENYMKNITEKAKKKFSDIPQ